jgi:ABC-type molybdate transport system substrate-binding protein
VRGRGFAALLGALLAAGAVGAETRTPLQVLAAAPLTEAFRAINVFDWCGSEPRAELYLAESAAVLALALRGERADVLAAAGPEGFAPLVAAGVSLEPRRFATQDGVEYWIAPLRGAREPATAQAFVDAVLSRRGQQALRARGFAPAAE